jgi:hypothetical protein
MFYCGIRAIVEGNEPALISYMGEGLRKIF